MEDQLSNIPEQLSPYQAWLRRHNIKTFRSPHMDLEEEPWNACQTEGSAIEHVAKHGESGATTGTSEAAAIAALVQKNNIPPFGQDELKAIRRL